MTAPIVAAGAAVLLVVGSAFQLALAVGAPWGVAAYGGRASGPDGRLPGRFRVASAATAVGLAGAAWVLLGAGDLVPAPLSDAHTRAVLWVLVVLFALNTVGNLAARHPAERWGAGAVTASLTVLCALAAGG